MADSLRRRVLQIGKFYPPYRGGMEQVLETLCSGLRPRFDVMALVANTGRRTVVERREGVPVIRLGTAVRVASASFCPGMTRVIRRMGADIVHLHLPNPSAALAYLRSGHPGRLIVSWHSDIVRQRVIGRLLDPLHHDVLGRAAAIVVATPAHLRTPSMLHRYEDRCRTIPFGIDLPRFETANEGTVRDVRERYGDRIVLAAGRLVYYKGFEYLVAAMADVDATLLIAGDGPLRRRLEALACTLPEPSRIVFLGGVPDLAPYYHAADVFVLPSSARSEAFGIVQVEAMAAGVPVINTSLETGVPLVSLHGETGLTVPPADSRALAAALRRLLDDDEFRDRLGGAGRRRARREYSRGLMIERMAELYECVLQ